MIATAVHLMTGLERPLLLEGPPGVGKTALARALSQVSGRRLVRLQCHEGIDDARALYEWDYGRQLLATQLMAAGLSTNGSPRSGADGGESTDPSDLTDAVTGLFDESFLLERPLLTAIRSPTPVVLLIDEVDRADEAFDALLLEVLDEGQITLPEIGTIAAVTMPWVLLTSNETRELADALKRRCLRVGIGYPTIERERQIVAAAAPGLHENLLHSLTEALGQLRQLALHKPPGIAEAIDWARALVLLGANELDAQTIERTLATIVKHERDERTTRQALMTTPLS